MTSGRPKYARNKNILVIGGSDSGKTRFFVKPNLMQMHSSYTYHEVSDEQKKLFVKEQEILGKCPNCGGQVAKGKFGAYCMDKCDMNVSRIMGVALFDTQVKDLLSGKKILLKRLKSKMGKKYDAYIIPTGVEDYSYTKDGETKSGKRFKFSMDYPKHKKKEEVVRMLTTRDKLLNILKEEEISIPEGIGICVHELRADGESYSVSAQKDTLAKLIVVSEINSVELGELIHTILEKGIEEYGFYE